MSVYVRHTFPGLRAWTAVLGALSCGVLVVSCASAPPMSPGLNEEIVQPEARAPARGPSVLPGKHAPKAPGAAPFAEDVLYNLTPAAHVPGVTSSPVPAAEAAPRAVPEGEASLYPIHPRLKPIIEPASLTDRLPDAALVAELTARWTKRWTAIAGGLGDTGGDDTGLRDPVLVRRELSRHLVALSFLTTGNSAGHPALEEALAALVNGTASRDDLLLAAAGFQHAGRDEDVTTVLAQFGADGTEVTAPDDPAAASPASFAVVGLTFAKSIDGPGKFEPTAQQDIAPGKSVLIYGEFRNFRTVKEKTADDENPAYRRAFAASLRLYSSAGEELDRLEFLPGKRGRQVAAAPAEVMNFWARYRLPQDLKPGEYKIVVEAEDVLGSASASADLTFAIGRD